MLNNTWQENLKTSLAQPDNRASRTRLAIMGIGHELCGDDAVGVHLAATLRHSIPADENLLVLEAGAAPENFTGCLRRFQPDLVLLIDAAEMGAEPGAVSWLDWEKMDGVSASTHTLPLSILVGYMQAEFKCRVALIGIQPEQTFSDGPLSRRVRKAARDVVREISEYIRMEQIRGRSSPAELGITNHIKKGKGNG